MRRPIKHQPKIPWPRVLRIIGKTLLIVSFPVLAALYYWFICTLPDLAPGQY